MANWYEEFRKKMVVSGENSDVLDIMRALDEIEVKKVNELEISEIQNEIEKLDVNVIIRGQLARRLRMLQKRLDRTVPLDFGAYLRYLREKNGYSLKNIEQAVGISTSYLNRLEMGIRKNPSYPIISKLAEVLQVPITRMLNVATSSQENATDIIELLHERSFTIIGKLLREVEKRMVIEIFEKLINCNWSNETIFSDSIELMETFNTFKQMIVNLETTEEKSVQQFNCS